jgi:hypothetical protein
MLNRLSCVHARSILLCYICRFFHQHDAYLVTCWLVVTHASGSIPVWWSWFYWVNPMTYVTNALAYNEMTAPRWSTPISINGVTQTTGMWALQSFELPTDPYWRWMPALVLIGFGILFNVITFLALEYLPRECGSGHRRIIAVISCLLICFRLTAVL